MVERMTLALNAVWYVGHKFHHNYAAIDVNDDTDIVDLSLLVDMRQNIEITTNCVGFCATILDYLAEEDFPSSDIFLYEVAAGFGLDKANHMVLVVADETGRRWIVGDTNILPVSIISPLDRYIWDVHYIWSVDKETGELIRKPTLKGVST